MTLINCFPHIPNEISKEISSYLSDEERKEMMQTSKQNYVTFSQNSLPVWQLHGAVNLHFKRGCQIGARQYSQIDSEKIDNVTETLLTVSVVVLSASAIIGFRTSGVALMTKGVALGALRLGASNTLVSISAITTFLASSCFLSCFPEMTSFTGATVILIRSTEHRAISTLAVTAIGLTATATGYLPSVGNGLLAASVIRLMSLSDMESFIKEFSGTLSKVAQSPTCIKLASYSVGAFYALKETFSWARNRAIPK